jgi:hypothetical protein
MRLSQRCAQGRRDHAHLVGGRAAAAAVCPPELCLQTLKGLRDHARLTEATGACDVPSQDESPPCANVEVSTMTSAASAENEEYHDEVTGELLPPKLVHAARAEELKYFETKKVYVRVPQDEARQVTGKPPITIRWIYVNKGDSQNPEIRARLVARQIRHGPRDDDLYAANPPLESLRWLFSLAATGRTWRGSPGHSEKLTFVDVCRAYFNADIEEPTFIELLVEDAMPGMVGRLLKCLYGTRGAAHGRENKYS